MAGPLTFVRFKGREVANGARMIEYLRNGLGTNRWELSADLMCGVLYREAGTFYSQAVAGDDPLEYWRLGETDGVMAEGEQGYADLAYRGAVTLGAAGAINGDIDSAVTLAAASYLEAVDVPSFGFAGTEPFSVEAWVKPSTVDASSRLIAGVRSAVAGNGWGITLDSTRLRFSRRNVAGVDQCDYAHSGAIAAGSWYHVVATYDGATLTLYVNGVSVATHASTRVVPEATVALRVGLEADGAGASQFLGSVDEVAVYSSAVTFAAAHHTAGATAHTAGQVFVSPAADPAPWYDPDEPGSGSFLGVMLLGFTGYDSVVSRTITQRVGGLQGGSFIGERLLPRTWKFRAALISSDDHGAEYGMRWLEWALSADCDQCATGDIEVRLSCAPEDGSDDTVGLWVSKAVALVDGPHDVEQFAPGSPVDALGGCRDWVTVEWTMQAENPALHKPAVTRLAPTVLGSVPGPDCLAATAAYPGGFWPAGMYPAGAEELFDSAPGECVSVAVTPPRRGTLAAIFTIRSLSGMGEVLLESHASCPGTAAGTPATQMVLSSIPARSTVVVDGSARTVTVTKPDDANAVNVGPSQSIGPTWSGNFPNDYKDVSPVTIAKAGWLSELRTYFKCEGTGTITLRPILYRDNGSGAAGDLVGYGDDQIVDAGLAADWLTGSFGHLRVEPGDYWIGWHSGAITGAPQLEYAYDGTSGDSGYNSAINDTFSDGPSDPFGAFGVNGWTVSMYAVFVPEADFNGESLLNPTGALEWVEARDCDTVGCFCARPGSVCGGGADTTVQIATQLREQDAR